MTTFLRILEASVDEKPHALLSAVASLHDDKQDDAFHRAAYERESMMFSALPGSPFAYWGVPTALLAFKNHGALKAAGIDALSTNQLSDDNRYARLWWENGSAQPGWAVWAKGRTFSPFYYDTQTLVRWNHERGTYTGFLGTADRPLEKPASADWFFRPGLTWPRRSSRLSVSALPAGCVFGNKGPAMYIHRDRPAGLLALLALTNSAGFRYLLSLQTARVELAQSYEVGLVQQTPIPDISEESTIMLAALARRAWSLKRLLDTTNETSHAFALPPGTLGYEASPLHPQAGGFNRVDIHRELAEIQAEIDDKVFSLYGISDEDRATIEASMSGGASGTSDTDSADDESPDEGDDSEDDSESTVELTATTLTTYSWLVGVAFGRFDPRLATRKRAIPSEPEPFDPLPARSPGMWPEGEEPDAVPPDIMVDDPGHDHDIRMLVASAAAMTGWPDPDDLRQWLAKEFFPLHIKMYSKSRRKAPIYWQLATPSASYSVWLYIHAFTKDTLFRVQNDYVAPKLAHEQRKLESLQAASQEGQTAADRKDLASQESLVEELRAFLDEVKRVAPLWNPNLDDGVIINFSLLWRLVPQHKPWQKELKSTWDALCAGKYDWAHLAMHLWPERVVPQCAKDRSLAIAHGLEEVFWAEGSDGKWTARKTPTTRVSELIQERTSPAVQDALKRLLSAPAPAAGGAKKKGPRKKTARKSKAAKAKGDSV